MRRVLAWTLFLVLVWLWLNRPRPDSPQTPVPTASPVITTPTSVQVPAVTGLKLLAARDTVEANRLSVRVRYRTSNEPPGTVLFQRPNAGAEVDESTQVVLRVAKPPLKAVPRVFGLSLENAKDALKSEGLRVSTKYKETSSYTEGTVISQTPGAGTKVAASTTVRVLVAKAKDNCDRNYSDCLDRTASDYDCAGGSGDGPKYTGLVKVLHSDHFDLDSDDDGYGCE